MMLASIPMVFLLGLGPLTGPTPMLQTPVEGGPARNQEELERLTAWPQLEKRLKSRVKLEIDKLRKAATPEMESSARTALGELGGSAAPLLLRALGKERKPEPRVRFASVLESLTDARHTRLLAEYFDDKSIELRVFCLRRTASFPDLGVREAAEKAWQAVELLAKKGRADERERYAAALATISSGSITALDAVFERTKSSWRKEARAIRAACEGARNSTATAELLKRLKGTKQEQLAALRMLSGCGTDAALPELKRLLNSSDQTIRLATVNALRGIVDGAPALKKVSVFDTIEEVDGWKKRI